MDVRKRCSLLFLLFIVVLGGCIMSNLNRYFMKQNLKSRNTSVIWAQREHLEKDPCSYATKLYQYKPGGETVLLEDRYEFIDLTCGSDKEKLLALIKNDTGFYVAEYNIKSRELKNVLDSEQIDRFLSQNGYHEPVSRENGKCIRYYKDEAGISLIYGNYIVGYSGEEGMEILYTYGDTPRMMYEWMENDTALLVNDGNKLIKYDIYDQKGTTLLVQSRMFNFVLSGDEKFVIFEDTAKGFLWCYDLDNGKRKKLCRRYHFLPTLKMSGDNQYFMCLDAVQILSSYKEFLFIINAENGRKIKLEEWGFETVIVAVTWNQ